MNSNAPKLWGKDFPYHVNSSSVLLCVFRHRLKKAEDKTHLLETLLHLAENHFLLPPIENFNQVIKVHQYENNQFTAEDNAWIDEKVETFNFSPPASTMDQFDVVVQELFSGEISWKVIVKYVAFAHRLATKAMTLGLIHKVEEVYVWCKMWFTLPRIYNDDLPMVNAINLDTWIRIAGGWRECGEGFPHRVITVYKTALRAEKDVEEYMSALRLQHPNVHKQKKEGNKEGNAGDNGEIGAEETNMSPEDKKPEVQQPVVFGKRTNPFPNRPVVAKKEEAEPANNDDGDNKNGEEWKPTQSTENFENASEEPENVPAEKTRENSITNVEGGMAGKTRESSRRNVEGGTAEKTRENSITNVEGGMAGKTRESSRRNVEGGTAEKTRENSRTNVEGGTAEKTRENSRRNVEEADK